jgi:hypothetical protein
MGYGGADAVIEYRAAIESDWPILHPFFCKIYRPHHPLQNFEFWRWQFLGQGPSGSFIACDQGRVVGHSGSYFRAGYAWQINLYVEEQYRGQGIVRELHGMARDYFPLAWTNVNRHALHHLRTSKCIRYCDLQRFVAINPEVKDGTRLSDRLTIDPGWGPAREDYYWQQPGIKGFLLPDGSTAVNQLNVGGLRVIDLVNIDEVASACWKAGVTWIDFVTSWNDPLCRALEAKGWYLNDECPVPWLLDPVVHGSKARITYLSEEPMPHDVIVKRVYSDHGRIGSLPETGRPAP